MMFMMVDKTGDIRDANKALPRRRLRAVRSPLSTVNVIPAEQSMHLSAQKK